MLTDKELFDAFASFLAGYLLTVFILRYIILFVFIRKKMKVIRKRNKGTSLKTRLLLIRFKNNFPRWLFIFNTFYILLLPSFLVLFLVSLLWVPMKIFIVEFVMLKVRFDFLIYLLFLIYFLYCRVTKKDF